jgi:acyl carrier protein
MNAQGTLREIFAAVLGCDGAALRDGDSLGTVKGWDSMNHLQLLLAIEEAFGVEFSPEELANLTSFGSLLRRVGPPDAAAVGGADQ